MPQAEIFTQDSSGDLSPYIPFGSLIPIQGGVSTPTSDSIEVESGLLAADYRTSERLVHFHESLYDLADDSHLVRFLKALLGDSGAGQLRKRSLVTRLQTTINGSRFYDLDRFYGAIFGSARKIPEFLPVDPMESTATPDEWDEITSSDSLYRSRVTALARAVPMGGTVPGLTAAAEAIMGVDCDIYETWPLIDNYGAGSGNTGRVWDDVETDFPTWGDFPSTLPDAIAWNEVMDQILFGRTGINSRSEIVVRPKKTYDDSPEGRIDRLEDEMALIQVLGKLKPANILLTVDPDGLALHRPSTVASITSDSDYWEVVPKVTPRGTGTRWAKIYPHSQVRVKKGLSQETSPRILPRPPLGGTQGREWDHNSFVSSARGYTLDDDGNEVVGDNVDLVMNEDGQIVPFSAPAGLSDPRALAGARATGDGVLVSHPYSGPRQVARTTSGY
jgi:hypothetical protein